MSYLIFARKYRPKTFEEMIGQKAVVQTLRNAIQSGRITQAYLFSGMRGTGKTTAARILAKALNCQNGPTPTPCNACPSCEAVNDDRAIDVLEIDGASNRSIEDIKALRESVKYKPLQSRTKVIIIDEVHQLSKDAFNALLKTLEEPPPNTVFIFATTEFNKVPATIVSRCQHFEFKKISHKEIINHLSDIAKKENLTITPFGLSLIAESADGSLRDAQSLLDQAVAFSGENIRDDDLKVILGAISRDVFFEFSSAILEEKPSLIFPLVNRLLENGIDLRFFFKELIEHFRDLLLVHSVEKPEDLLYLGPEEMVKLKEQSAKAAAEDFLRYLLALQQGEAGLRYSSHPRIYLETLLVKLCLFKKLAPLEELIREVSLLKRETVGEAPAKPAPGGAVSGSPPGGKAAVQAPSRQALPATPSAKPPQGSDKPSTQEFFGKILENLQKDKAALAAILAQYSSVRLKEGVLDVFFSSGKTFYIGAIQKDLRFVEKAASEVLGQAVSVRLAEEIVEEGSPREKETEAALKDPAVRTFMNTFKAQVLSVDSVKKPRDQE